MIVDIEVKRPPGDRLGPEISDSFLTSEPAALARGEAEINASFPARRKIITINTHWMPYQRPGSMGKIIVGGKTIIGMVVSFDRDIKISGSTFTVDTQLTMEVLDE